MATAQELYLDLLKNCLTRTIFEDDFTLYTDPQLRNPVQRWLKRGSPGMRWLKRTVLKAMQDTGLELYTRIPFDRKKREMGRDWPREAETMIGLRRLDNIQTCIETVINEEIPGDLVETGVWRGGASIFMRAVLKAYEVSNRKVWCADSFQGLPAPNTEKYPQDQDVVWHTQSALAVSRNIVEKNFTKYGMLDDNVVFLEGWFKDTLPHAPINNIALLRLDGDMYESTMDALNSLYNKVSPGGFVIIDDYGIPENTCRGAIHEFRESHGIIEPIVDIDGWGAFWRRSSGHDLNPGSVRQA